MSPKVWRKRAAAHEQLGEKELARLCEEAARTIEFLAKLKSRRIKHKQQTTR